MGLTILRIILSAKTRWWYVFSTRRYVSHLRFLCYPGVTSKLLLTFFSVKRLCKRKDLVTSWVFIIGTFMYWLCTIYCNWTIVMLVSFYISRVREWLCIRGVLLNSSKEGMGEYCHNIGVPSSCAVKWREWKHIFYQKFFGVFNFSFLRKFKKFFGI